MLYRKLGRTGGEVSNLGFGCMRLPLKDMGAGAEPPRLADVDEDRSIELLRSAMDQGVNYFDTAYSYHGGKSEGVLGRAVQGRREKVLLTTKLPVWLVETAESFDRLLEEQLHRLGTSYLDFYLLHALDGALWQKVSGLGVLKFLDRIVAEGKARRVGFSFHDDLAVFKKIVDSYNWDVCQIQLNYLDRNYQAGQEGLRYAAAKGLGVVIMEPLRGGTLTNPVPAEVTGHLGFGGEEEIGRRMGPGLALGSTAGGDGVERHEFGRAAAGKYRNREPGHALFPVGGGSGGHRPGDRDLPRTIQNWMHGLRLLPALSPGRRHPEELQAVQRRPPFP